MSNLFTVFVFVALTSTVQGATISPFDDIVNAANSGEWDKFQKLVYDRFGADGWKTDFSANILANRNQIGIVLANFNQNFDSLDEEVRPSSVRDLKPPKGGHVYGESEYTFHSATDDNGRRSETSGGHKIINNDGKVQEYDFKPENLPKLPNNEFKDLFKDVEFKDLLKDFKPVGFKAEDFKPTVDFKPEDLKLVDFSPQPAFGSQSQPSRYQKGRSFWNY